MAKTVRQKIDGQLMGKVNNFAKKREKTAFFSEKCGFFGGKRWIRTQDCEKLWSESAYLARFSL